MASTITLAGDWLMSIGNRFMTSGTGNLGNYATNGVAVTATQVGLGVTEELRVHPAGGYVFEWDKANAKIKAYRGAGFTPAGTLDSVTGGTPAGTNSAPGFTGTANVGTAGIVDDDDNAATVGHALYVVPDVGPPVYNVVLEAAATGLVKDSDTAATEGVQIYVVVDDVEFLPGYQLGHLEFVSPTNAHGSCTIANGAQTLLIEDDDAAATNGVEVRAIAASGGLEATLPGAVGPCLVPLSDGNYLNIADSTTGATPAIYFDEDAANTYERLRAVVVDNLDEPYKVAESSHLIARPSAMAGRLAKFVTVGPGDTTSTGIVGVAGPSFVVSHDQAAAQMVGAAVLYAQAAGAGFNAALPGGLDVYVPVSNGEFIKIAHAASPAGVQVYWDHDSANANERMKAVVVDNLDETFSTEAAVGWRRDTPAGTVAAPTFTGNALAGHLHTLTGTAVAATAMVEVANGVALGGITFRFEAIGY